MKNKPRTIFLVCWEGIEKDTDFKEIEEEVCWCQDKVFPDDIEYIRKDLIEHIIGGALGPQDALNKIRSL